MEFEIEDGVLTYYGGPGGNVVVPESVTGINGFAFCECEMLKQITLPNGLISIDAFAFWKCANLSKIIMPTSATEIHNLAFADCDSLTIHAPAESYAIQFAKENGIQYEEL